MSTVDEGTNKISVREPSDGIPALRSQSIDELATRIEEEHYLAQRSMYESLDHARTAGTLLTEVKGRLKHGEFMPWVAKNAGLAHSTANLYMKVASEWDALMEAREKSQHVRTLSLRNAAQFLYFTEDEDFENAASALVHLEVRSGSMVGLLDWDDLRALSPMEARVIVSEVRRLYEDCCCEPDQELSAKRIAQRWEPQPGSMLYSRGAIRSLAREVIEGMRRGSVGPQQARKKLRALNAVVLRAQKRAIADGAGIATGPVGCVIDPRAYIDGIREQAHRFIGAANRLLTGSHGLLDQRLILSDAERNELITFTSSMRDALDLLQQQARSHAEFLADEKEAMDASPPWIDDDREESDLTSEPATVS